MDLTSDGLDDAVSFLSPQVIYTVPGRSPLAGVFHGPDAVRVHLAKLLRITSGTFEVLKWVDWMVGLSHVSALQYAQAQGGGIIYRGHHLYLVETDHNDLLTDIRVFFEEQLEADRFLTHLARE